MNILNSFVLLELPAAKQSIMKTLLWFDSVFVQSCSSLCFVKQKQKMILSQILKKKKKKKKKKRLNMAS